MTNPRKVRAMPPLLGRLFWGVLLLSLATGLWLHGARRSLYGSFGIAGSLHVVLGWAALPVLLLYQAFHIATRWREALRRERTGGIGALLLSGLLLLSGVSLLVTGLPLPAAAERNLHLWTTFGLGFVLLFHGGPAALRRFRRPV